MPFKDKLLGLMNFILYYFLILWQSLKSIITTIAMPNSVIIILIIFLAYALIVSRYLAVALIAVVIITIHMIKIYMTGGHTRWRRDKTIGKYGFWSNTSVKKKLEQMKENKPEQ